MSSWLAGKVSGLVKDAHRLSAPVQWTADDLAADLTQQARGPNSPESAFELVSRWNDQIKTSTTRFPLRAEEAGSMAGSGEQLSYHLVLLRSQAFETLLDTCTKVPAISATLASEAENTPLGRALHTCAEQVLLPGSLRLWPTLLEALLDNDDGSKAAGPKWRPWARHVLTSMKRRWESEALVSDVRKLDRQLGELCAATRQQDDSAANTEWQRQGAEGKLSKRGIRAALARSKLRRCNVESDSLRRRTELLSDICERLHAMEGCTAASIPNLERLVSDAEKAVETLDSGEEKLGADQEALGKDVSDLGGELENQITGLMLMHDSFAKKRTGLCHAREELMRQLQEIDAQITQLDEESTRTKNQVVQLRGQFENMTKHYDSRNVGILSKQRGVTDRKALALSFRSMSEQALAVAQADAKRDDTELRTMLDRRSRELKHTCASYVNSERLRLDTATDCLDDSRMVSQAGPAAAGEDEVGEELAELMAVTQGAWRSAQAILQRVERLVDTNEPSESRAANPLDTNSSSERSVEMSTEEAREFFASEAVFAQGCVDCGTPIAEWASITCGVYLCMDCAGLHRGLGVHLSFVRSMKMDKWSSDQLQRMKLGGSTRFSEFLEGFPELRDQGGSLSATAFSARYTSRAASFYRHRLDAECAGRDFSTPAPTGAEGHLPAEGWPATGQLSSASEAADRPVRSTSDMADGPAATLKEERAALEAVYLELQCRLRDALVPQ